MTAEEVLQKKVDRQKRQIELLEAMIEDRARDIFTINEELRVSNAALTSSLDELKSTQRALIDASRKAGMADVATSVLHNVGNVLNSVNVSATVLHGLLRTTKATGVGKAVSLLRAQPDPGRFLLEDRRGVKLLDYLAGLGAALEAERAKASDELTVIEKNIDHIKAIVSSQQALARSGASKPDANERISIKRQCEELLLVARASLAGVETVPDFSGLGGDDSMTIDRHKLFQILLNLVTNAGHALKPRAADRRIDLRVRREGAQIVFEVEDNGIGIPADNLARIFGHGFTTRESGHGFGLHSCANAAAEMGGRLEARSDGPGTGATFTLTVPSAPGATVTSACPPAAASASP